MIIKVYQSGIFILFNNKSNQLSKNSARISIAYSLIICKKNYTPSSGKLRPDIPPMHCLSGLCEGSTEHGECTHFRAYTYRS